MLLAEMLSNNWVISMSVVYPFNTGIIFLILAHPVYKNVNNTGTKYVRIMKQTAFWREKNGEYMPCLKYSVAIFVE